MDLSHVVNNKLPPQHPAGENRLRVAPRKGLNNAVFILILYHTPAQPRKRNIRDQSLKQLSLADFPLITESNEVQIVLMKLISFPTKFFVMTWHGGSWLN